MPGTQTIPASQAIVTLTQPGVGEEEMTLGGDALYRSNAPTRDLLDTMGTSNQYGWKFGKGQITLTLVTDKDLSIARNMVSGQIRISYPGNLRLITLGGVTQFGDAVEENTTSAGTTGAITFGFDTGTDSNA